MSAPSSEKAAWILAVTLVLTVLGISTAVGLYVQKKYFVPSGFISKNIPEAAVPVIFDCGEKK